MKVEDKTDDMELRENKVDSMNDYDVDLKQKMGIVDQNKIVFGQSGGGYSY